MKSILLASASVLAFAGAAAAEITFSGEATLGYNDRPSGDNDGFYSDLDLTIGFSQELDNGLTAGASVTVSDLLDGSGLENGLDYELFLTSETAGLYYGSTAFAAESMWVSAGPMQNDSFSEQDGEEVLRGEVMFGGVTAAVSYALSNADDPRTRVGAARADGRDLDQLSVAVVGDFGGVNVVLAYQEESGVPAGAHYNTNNDFNEGEVVGLSVGTSFAGADVRLAYAGTSDNVGDGSGVAADSMGIKIAYPIGPVTASVYYVGESVGDDSYGLSVAYADGPIAVTVFYDNEQGGESGGIEGSYDIGNGLMAYAGYLTEDGAADAYYVAGSYDLGGGAALLVSFADDADNSGGDEIGSNDYQRGTTVELTFAF